MKEVSVVISTYSRKRLGQVLECLGSLRKQSLLPKEIILVLDPDQQLIEFYKSRLPSFVKILVSEGFGLSLARNKGIKGARSEIVAFIDDDALAKNNWLEKLVENYGKVLVQFGSRRNWIGC
jgi:glycosyltransferase involved in cell wall biosynthesis